VHTGNNVSFTNTSTIGNVPGERRAWWYFGDGSSQSSPALGNMQHHYNVAGTYTVCLKIFRYSNSGNDSTLTGSICKTIVLESLCSANFEYQVVSTGTNPAVRVVNFTAIPSHSQNRPVLEVCWNFGDGTPIVCRQASTSVPPTNLLQIQHTFTSAGPYNVCVRIKYQEGCVGEKCRIIQLPTIPPDSCRANFERINISPTANPLHATFKALPWHSNNKKPVFICWDFGDGRDTCIQYSNTYTGPYTVNHLYSTMGLYEVCVKIRYEGGCEKRKCDEIRIGRPDSCSASFTRLPVNSMANPLSVVLKALPWHNNNKKPARICWEFGDGTDTCINYLNVYNGLYSVPHTYSQPGLYNVCVKIRYYGGCEARKCETVRVERPDSCRADFERLPTVASSPLSASFKALPWNNNNRKPQRVCWTFGDGRDTCITYPETYTGQYTVGHQYAQPGQYEVCVKIKYYGGCEARKCKMISIPPPPVTCSVNLFELTQSVNSLTRGFLAVPQSNPPRRPELVCWNFGDGTDTCITIDPTQPMPNLAITHTYPGPGVYHACVRVRFQGGCVAEKCKEVVIRPAANVCGGYMVDSLSGPRTFKFRGFSIHSPGDQVISYQWSFGDGTSSMGQTVTHTYNVAGLYEVCLKIKTRMGCETRICKTLRVPGNNNQPVLVITPNPVINQMHATFFSTHTETVNIKIMNQFGVVVRTYTRSAITGSNTWGFDLGTLMPGIYTFTVQSPNQLASAVFIKL
jgi:PKD repeat protein